MVWGLIGTALPDEKLKCGADERIDVYWRSLGVLSWQHVRLLLENRLTYTDGRLDFRLSYFAASARSGKSISLNCWRVKVFS